MRAISSQILKVSNMIILLKRKTLKSLCQGSGNNLMDIWRQPTPGQIKTATNRLVSYYNLGLLFDSITDNENCNYDFKIKT